MNNNSNNCGGCGTTCSECGRPWAICKQDGGCGCNKCKDIKFCEYGRMTNGCIREKQPGCPMQAVIPSVTVESIEGIKNLADCLVHVSDINTTFYIDDKHRPIITWAGPINIPGYDMEGNPNNYRDQIVTDVANQMAVIYDKSGKGYLFGLAENIDLQEQVNNKLDEMAGDGTLTEIIGGYVDGVVDPKIDVIVEKVDNQYQAIASINTQVQAVASGSPAGVYATVSALTTADPDHTRIYLVSADGKWYYWSGSAWTAGGTYQGTTLLDNSVSANNLNLDLSEIKGLEVINATYTDGTYVYNSDPNAKVVATTTSSNKTKISDPIFVKGGKTIVLQCQAYTKAIAIFSTCDSDGTNIEPVLYDTGTAGTQAVYSYDVPSDCYMIVSARKQNFGCLFVYDTPIKQNKVGIANNDPEHHNLLINRTLITDGSNCTAALNNTNDEYQKELQIDVNYTTGSGAYSWAWYTMIDSTISSTTCDSVTFAVDIKTTDISNRRLSLYARINNATLAVGKYNAHIYDLDTEYKRYYLTVNFTTRSVTNIKLIIGERDDAQDLVGNLNATFKVRYAGWTLGNREQLAIEPYTFLDRKSQYTIESDITGGMFSSFVTFGSIGDSLASGESVANNGGELQYIDNNTFSWGQFIAREHGMTCNNYNQGGLTTRSWLTSSNGLTKLLQNGSDNRAFIIGLGVNDANRLGSAYIGSETDIDPADFHNNEDTFYGNYGRIISYCKQVQPKCKIFLYTIARTGSQYNGYNTAIRKIATLYDNVYLIDIASGTSYQSGFINDNLRSGHFNAIGYKAIANYMYLVMSQYMVNNQNEFKQIEFIGTDYSWN